MASTRALSPSLSPEPLFEAGLVGPEDVVIVLAGMPAWLLVLSGNTVLHSVLFPPGQVVCFFVAGTSLGVRATVVLPREDAYSSGLRLCL